MMGKVGMLRDFIKDMPDDADFVIEYPVKYSRKTINGEQETPIHKDGWDCASDFISGGTLGKEPDKKVLYIFHHY